MKGKTWPRSVSAATLAMVVATLAIVAMPGTDSCAGNVYPHHPGLATPPRPPPAWWLETGELHSGSGSGELRPGPDTGARARQYGHQASDRGDKQEYMSSLSWCLMDTNKCRMMIRVIRHNVYHYPWNQINYNAGYHQYPDISSMTHIVTAQEDNVTDTQCTVMLPLLSLDKD